MPPILLTTDDLLRGQGPFDARQSATAPARWWVLPAIVLLFTPVYGAVMGAYMLDTPRRLLQVLYSALKMPLLLGATSAICLPAYFVLTTVRGLRDDLWASLSAILAGQAAMAVALASLAPLTAVFYLSARGYNAVQLFNGLMFLLATLGAQAVVRRNFRPLIARNPRHRSMLAAWGVMYVFVGIQMAWTLRPFIGQPGARTTFFRDEPFTNAYVVVARLVSGLF